MWLLVASTAVYQQLPNSLHLDKLIFVPVRGDLGAFLEIRNISHIARLEPSLRNGVIPSTDFHVRMPQLCVTLDTGACWCECKTPIFPGLTPN
jgi:hypothetical protein